MTRTPPSRAQVVPAQRIASTSPPLPRAYGLDEAVVVALDALADPMARHPAVDDGRLAALLRTAIDHAARHGAGHGRARSTVSVERASAVVRVACAFLAARDPGEAYFVLLTADDLLTGRRHDQSAAPGLASAT